MKKAYTYIITALAALVLAACATTGPDYEILRRAEQAGARISDYETTSAPDGDDVLIGNDVSDTSMAATGTTKKFRIRDLPASDSVWSAISGKHPNMPGVAGDGANGVTVTGAVGASALTVGCLRHTGAYTVNLIPAAPAAGDKITVVNGAYPCDVTTGGGTSVYDLYYDGAAWQCLGGAGGGYQDQIFEDDTKVEVVDPGGATPGYIALTVDSTEVLRATKDGLLMGPIAATAALSADNTCSSLQLLTGSNAGEPVSRWQAVYFDGTAGEFLLADANVAGKWPAVGMALAASSDGNPIDVIESGYIRNDAWSWTPGQRLCLSETAGGIVGCADATICSADGDCAQVVGWAKTADIIFVNFTQGYDECNGN